jgi:hypothetical protein
MLIGLLLNNLYFDRLPHRLGDWNCLNSDGMCVYWRWTCGMTIHLSPNIFIKGRATIELRKLSKDKVAGSPADKMLG